MGESAAQTVREIEETRGRLETDIRELEDRLPSPAVWTKRLIGLAVGGGVGGALFWFTVRRARKRRKVAKAAEAARMQAVVQVLPEEWAEKVADFFEDDRWKGWAAAGVGAWALFRLAELRQLRRMNRSLLAAR
jgi:hypothetical protein